MGFLEGQVAIVTGGGRGVGRGIAKLLAAEGAAVAVDDLYRSPDGVSAAEATAAEIERAGGKALALHEDISTVAGTQAMAAAALERFGRIDVLVTCAGNIIAGGLQDVTEEQWDLVVKLHLKGHFLCCKAVLPAMRRQNSGRILTVSSRGAFFQVPNSKQDPWHGRKPSSTAYTAAKAGILGLTSALAIELWDTGITVNSLLPSAATQLFPDTKPRIIAGTPPTESLDPEDIAPAAVYLCSPHAANISGKVMYASGGDVIFFGEQLDMRGSRMLRKKGRWTVEELSQVVPSLIGVAPATS
ncbi:MAG: SDR family oxidoreductase [Rubrivivax sp.]